MTQPNTSPDQQIDLEPESAASLNLKRIRNALGVSQQELCDRLARLGGPIRLMQSQIAKIERGERPWRVNELVAIARVLDIGIGDLLCTDGVISDHSLGLLAASQRLRKAAVAEQAAHEAWAAAKADLERASAAFAAYVDGSTQISG